MFISTLLSIPHQDMKSKWKLLNTLVDQLLLARYHYLSYKMSKFLLSSSTVQENYYVYVIIFCKNQHISMSVPFKYKGLEHSNNINFDSFTVVYFDLYFEYYKRPLSYESKILRYCVNLNLCRLSRKHSVTMLSVIIFSSYYNNRESYHTSQNTFLFLKNLPFFKGEKLN